MGNPGFYFRSADVSQRKGDPSHWTCDNRVSVIYNAEEAELCDEPVGLASVAIKSCRRLSFQISVCRSVLGYPDWELSSLTMLRVIIESDALGKCRSGMHSGHHGSNCPSSACDINPSSIPWLCWVIIGEGSLAGLSPTCCSGLEMSSVGYRCAVCSVYRALSILVQIRSLCVHGGEMDVGNRRREISLSFTRHCVVADSISCRFSMCSTE